MSLYPPIVEPYLPGFPEDSAEYIIPYSLSPYQDETPDKIHVKILKINTNVSVLNNDLTYLTIPYSGDSKAKISRAAANLVMNQYYKIQLRFASADGKRLSEWSSICLIKLIEIPQISIKGWEKDGAVCTMTLEDPYTFRVQGNFNFGTRQTATGDYILEDTVQFYRVLFYDKESVHDSGNIIPKEKNLIDYSFPIKLETNTLYSFRIEYLTQSLYSNAKNFTFITKDGVLNNFEGEAFATPDTERGAIKVDVLMSSNKIFYSNFLIKRASDKDNFTNWTPVHLFSFDITKYNKLTPEELDRGSIPIETWYDNAIEADTFYRYSIHIYRKPMLLGDGSYSEEYIGPPMPFKKAPEEEDNIDRYVYGVGTSPAVSIALDNILLYDGVKQLKIQYNPEISSFKRNILDSKTDTLGSKYPFIRRNSATDYHSFQLSGLISYHMNEIFSEGNYKHFTDTFNGSIMGHKEEEDENKTVQTPIFDDERTVNYGAFLKQPKRTRDNMSKIEEEIFKERLFREEVMDFLYSDQVKLFKSETEGTFLVRLMNVSLTPEAQLGRMIYSFSAEVVEIDECNAENLEKYGLINLGEYDDDLGEYDTKAGQVRIDFSSLNFYESGYKKSIIKEGLSIVNPFILDKIAEKNSTNIFISLSSFEFLKIMFESDPYLIRVDDGSYDILKTASPLPGGSYIKGHLISLGDRKIIVKDRIFQFDKTGGLNEEVIENTQELFLSDTIKVYGIEPTDVVEVDYIANLYFEPNIYREYTNIYEKMGQVCGVFKYNNLYDSLITRLGEKYYFSDTYTNFCNLNAINSLEIEAEPGMTIMIQDSGDILTKSAMYYEHVIGATGRLFLFDENKVIKNCYAKGIRLTPESVEEPKRFFARDVEYRLIEAKNGLNNIDKAPIFETNVVFYEKQDETINYIIYYKGKKVSLIEGENDLLNYINGTVNSKLPNLYIDYPSEIIFNYIIEVEEGLYKKYR